MLDSKSMDVLQRWYPKMAADAIFTQIQPHFRAFLVTEMEQYLEAIAPAVSRNVMV
jgi:hypothetical protein